MLNKFLNDILNMNNIGQQILLALIVKIYVTSLYWLYTSSYVFDNLFLI